MIRAAIRTCPLGPGVYTEKAMQKNDKIMAGALGMLLLGGVFGVLGLEASRKKTVSIENSSLEKQAEKISPQEISLNEKESFVPGERQAAEENMDKEAVSPQELAREQKQEPSVPPKEEAGILKEKGKKGTSKIQEKLVGWGFERSATRSADTVVIHSSYNSLGGDKYDVEKIIAIYKSYGVAAHYIIGRQGDVYKLVEEKNVAYHAGESRMPDGRTGVNYFSIGIELVGDLESGFTKEQYSALNSLLADIKERHRIKSVLGHEDIAPGRKTDPWKIEWDKVKK